jgi:glycosyltransferase involved in cell wall biosynthesis
MGEIVVNGRFLGHPLSGMQRYAREVTKRLKGRVSVHAPERHLRSGAGHIWEQLVLPYAVGDRLLWSPCSSGPLAAPHQVLTLHDTSTLDCPEYFNPSFARYYSWLLPHLARRVKRIIASSEFTKSRIVELIGVPADRITVIHLGVDKSFSPKTEQDVERAKSAVGIELNRYLLTVGSIEPRKNLARLLDAWALIEPTIPSDLGLVIAGERGRSHIFRSSDFPSLPKRVFFAGHVDESLLPGLYTGALAFVCPSLYEGFGLPVLEAMACGVPVVASSNTALPEILGGAGVYCNPHSVESIADAMRQVLDQPTRTRLGQQTLQRSKLFTWERTTAATWAVLNETS